MNHYPKHLGDYAKDTGHLSMLEHGAFNLLLDWYYASEQPIPADKVYRIAKAATKAERQAVDAVLREFFTPAGNTGAGVWTNKRAEAEIERYREKSRKASASAGARWSASERNANASRAGMRTHMRTQCEGNASQEPIARSQEPELRSEGGGNSHGVPTPAAAVCARLRAEAGMVSTNPSHPELTEALANGITADEIVHAAIENRGKPMTYVIRTAVGRRKDAAASAAGGPHAATQPVRLTARDRALADNERHRQQREGGGRVFDA